MITYPVPLKYLREDQPPPPPPPPPSNDNNNSYYPRYPYNNNRMYQT